MVVDLVMLLTLKWLKKHKKPKEKKRGRHSLEMCHAIKKRCPYHWGYDGKRYWNMRTEKTILDMPSWSWNVAKKLEPWEISQLEKEWLQVAREEGFQKNEGLKNPSEKPFKKIQISVDRNNCYPL